VAMPMRPMQLVPNARAAQLRITKPSTPYQSKPIRDAVVSSVRIVLSHDHITHFDHEWGILPPSPIWFLSGISPPHAWIKTFPVSIHIPQRLFLSISLLVIFCITVGRSLLHSIDLSCNRHMLFGATQMQLSTSPSPLRIRSNVRRSLR
jgi:hypothetical protein